MVLDLAGEVVLARAGRVAEAPVLLVHEPQALLAVADRRLALVDALLQAGRRLAGGRRGPLALGLRLRGRRLGPGGARLERRAGLLAVRLLLRELRLERGHPRPRLVAALRGELAVRAQGLEPGVERAPLGGGLLELAGGLPGELLGGAALHGERLAGLGELPGEPLHLAGELALPRLGPRAVGADLPVQPGDSRPGPRRAPRPGGRGRRRAGARRARARGSAARSRRPPR
ncbi:MAG: hypothetical protein QM704_15235 [Anaeromyxobacteraceae bacterium]